jgi:HlyD family secretion protein
MACLVSSRRKRGHTRGEHESLIRTVNMKLAEVLATTLLAFVMTVCAGCKANAGDPKYETAPVSRGDVVQHVTATGTLGAVVSVDVGSQVSGKIAALNADFNSPVRKGELIAQIDPSVYLANLRQAEGDLANANAAVVLKRQNLERKKVLAPQRAASQFDLDQATAELTQAAATVVVKQAALDSARANLGYCKITSPVDGIVISRKVDVGQTVVAAMSTPVLFTIAQDIAKMHISAAVSEADIGQVKAGEGVDFTVDAFPDEVFHGRVSQVRKAPTTTSNVVTYETIIDVDNPGEKLFPGMTADASILVARKVDAIRISNAALRYTPPEDAQFNGSPPVKLGRGQRLAYALESDGIRLRPLILKVGITDGVNTEVLSGLTESTRVVISTLAAEARRRSPPPPPPG